MIAINTNTLLEINDNIPISATIINVIAFYETINTVYISGDTMIKRQSSQVVLLSRKQVEALLRIQVDERSRSEFGIQPSIHQIARRLVDKALGRD